jgi:hypothetical protein
MIGRMITLTCGICSPLPGESIPGSQAGPVSGGFVKTGKVFEPLKTKKGLGTSPYLHGRNALLAQSAISLWHT